MLILLDHLDQPSFTHHVTHRFTHRLLSPVSYNLLLINLHSQPPHTNSAQEELTALSETKSSVDALMHLKIRGLEKSLVILERPIADVHRMLGDRCTNPLSYYTPLIAPTLSHTTPH